MIAHSSTYRALTVAAALGAGALGTTAPAAAQDVEALAARRDKKLKAEFLQRADWITDYDEARARAKKARRPIFAYFTRSYSP